jgi:hypothetical protein
MAFGCHHRQTAHRVNDLSSGMVRGTDRTHSRAQTFRTVGPSGRSQTIWATIVALSLISVSGGCDSFNAEAYVQCNGALAGVTCAVTRRSGSARATVCWDVHFDCANGRESNARACHRVPDGREGMSSRLIPWSDFKGFDACDTVAATTVENLNITPD